MNCKLYCWCVYNKSAYPFIVGRLSDAARMTYYNQWYDELNWTNSHGLTVWLLGDRHRDQNRDFAEDPFWEIF